MKPNFSTMYAIHDPAHQDKIVHNGWYIIQDDWGNHYVMQYDAAKDGFWCNFDTDEINQAMWFVLDEGEYIEMRHDDRYNIIQGNRIWKFQPITFYPEGIKR